MNTRLFAAMVVTVFVLVSSKGEADVPPPEDYEEDCTLEKQHFDGMEGFTCDGGGAVSPEDEGACDPDANEAEGYSFVCNTLGASFNTEIWCKESPDATGPAGDPDASEDDGCSVVTPGAGAADWWVGGLFLIVATRFLSRKKNNG